MDVGKLKVELPPSWTAREEPGQFMIPEGGLVLLQHIGELPRIPKNEGPSLDERLRAAAEPIAKAAGVKEMGKPVQTVLGTVPALVVPLLPLGIAAAVVVDDDVVFFVGVWSSEAAFKAVNAFTQTFRPVLPKQSVVALPESAGGFVLCAALPSPKTWVALDGGPPNQASWWVPHSVLGCSEPVKFGAAFEAQPQCPLSLHEAVLRFVPRACRLFGKTLEPDPKKIAVVAQTQHVLDDGSMVATVVVEERDEGLQTRVIAHARGTAKGVYFGAAIMGPWMKGWQEKPAGAQADRIWERVDNVADVVLAVVANARSAPLPPEDAAAAAKLIEMGSWSRSTEYSHSSSSPSMMGVGSFSTFSSGRSHESWTFGAGVVDVDRQSSDFFSAYDSFTTPSGAPFTYSPILASWREPQGTTRYALRVLSIPNGPVILVRTSAEHGESTFHVLEWSKKGRYGKTETEGVAIDGRIEGHYADASGNLGSFSSWQKKKKS